MNTHINSHVQMPKFILKRFESEQYHTFSYYDVKKDFVAKNGHSSSLNTITDYYSKQMEQFLNNKFETPFSKLLNKIAEADLNSLSVLSQEEEKLFKQFVYMLSSRDITRVHELFGSTVYSQFYSAQEKRDFSVISSLKILNYKNPLSHYVPTVLINKTKTPLILPICGIFGYKRFDISYIVFPITPERALILLEDKGLGLLLDDRHTMYYIDEDESIIDLDRRAFFAQAKQEYGYVISSRIDLLSTFQNEWKMYKK